MARPVEPHKRRELAAAAVAVLQRRGTDVSMAELAAELGVKRPTLLYHFPTKAHLVEEALVELLMEQAAFVLPRVEAHEHPIDRLYAQMTAIHEFHHGHEARVVFLTQAIASTAGERTEAILAAGAQVFEAHRRDLRARLRRGVADGTVGPCDPDALLATCRALTDGLLVQRVVMGLALAPVHALVWERLLAPLKVTPGRGRAGATGGRPARARSTVKR
ncbi:MAG: TetR/AcrR family transcriptional regulator [Polyangiaceae bacterium]|nr:TetR/AcrR family transcriptional regulator [Polyangiaceae bacterium]